MAQLDARPLPRAKDYEDLPEQEVRERAWRARRALGANAVILTHHYQADEIVEFGDYRGDSLELSRIAAAQRQAHYIVFCGVDFMAESAAILAGPEQIVVMPAGEAPCPMAAMATAPDFATAWAHLEALWGSNSVTPVVYQNTGAAVKAFCGAHGGAVCTSANAGPVLAWGLAQRGRVLFLPDRYLSVNSAHALGIPDEQIGLWLHRQGVLQAPGGPSGLKLVAWDGFCHVHKAFTVSDVEQARREHPGIRIIVHPECTPEVVQAADQAGSTSFIVRQVEQAPAGTEFGIGTEAHLVERLAKENPDKLVVPLRRNVCGTMARTDIYNLCYVLEHLAAGQPVSVITVEPGVAEQARLALQRMLDIK